MKRIAVIGNRNYKKNENYYEAIEAVGADPVALELYERVISLDNLDGLIIPGGTDLNPRLYKEDNTESVDIDDELDEFEINVLKKAVEIRLPILGICRGLQLLNVFFGGSLIQNIACCDKHKRFHHIDNCHNVTLAPHSFLREIYDTDEISVNSAHHQAVKKAAENFAVTAFSCNERIVEAIEHKSLPIYAVQFHPERMCLKNKRDDTVDGLEIFNFFIRKC